MKKYIRLSILIVVVFSLIATVSGCKGKTDYTGKTVRAYNGDYELTLKFDSKNTGTLTYNLGEETRFSLQGNNIYISDDMIYVPLNGKLEQVFCGLFFSGSHIYLDPYAMDAGDTRKSYTIKSIK